jgi:hypothetical protein
MGFNVYTEEFGGVFQGIHFAPLIRLPPAKNSSIEALTRGSYDWRVNGQWVPSI